MPKRRPAEGAARGKAGSALQAKRAGGKQRRKVRAGGRERGGAGREVAARGPNGSPERASGVLCGAWRRRRARGSVHALRHVRTRAELAKSCSRDGASWASRGQHRIRASGMHRACAPEATEGALDARAGAPGGKAPFWRRLLAALGRALPTPALAARLRV